MTVRMARGPLLGRLGVRLMATIGLVLLPLAMLAYVQGGQFQSEAVARVQAALFGETLVAAAPTIEAIKKARGAAAALAISIEPVLSDDVACRTVMRGYVASEPTISFATFVPVSGQATCVSRGDPLDLSQSPRFIQTTTERQPSMTANPMGAVSGESVLVFTHPVFARDGGAYLGFVSLSLPHRTLQIDRAPDKSAAALEPLALMTFDAEGTVLTAANGLETADSRLPAGRALTSFVGRGPTTFTGRTTAGDERTFAVIPMVEGSLYILSSWPPPARVIGSFGENIPLWLFPTGMWLVSMAVAWLAAELQVLRHIRALRSSITTFADGNRTVDPPNLERAPAELRDVGDAYERLVDSVLHDEAALEDTIHQKEVLLREVHHRVKNNLQLIASIMNIQMRKAVSPEAKALVRGLHDRVMSLATVHRELYQTSGLADVKADELLSTISTQVLRMGALPSRPVDVNTHFDPIRLTPDQSVPLSLLLTEALTNVLKHAGSGNGQRIALTVSLTRQPEGRALLRVSNSLSGNGIDRTSPPRADSTGMGEQLLSAFAMQLSGALSVTQEEDTYVLSVNFPVNALSEGEHRFAAS